MTPGNVRALRENRKWETRRLNTYWHGQTHERKPARVCGIARADDGTGQWYFHEESGAVVILKEPFSPGDTVWIQENHRLLTEDPHRRKVRCQYEEDGSKRILELTPGEWEKYTARRGKPGRFTPGRFMFQSCARLTRRVAMVRAQFLHSITDSDAWAEGISPDLTTDRPLQALLNVCIQFPDLNIGSLAADDPELFDFGNDRNVPTDYEKVTWTTARGAYAALWEGIHGQGSWAKNPIVWTYTFERP